MTPRARRPPRPALRALGIGTGAIVLAAAALARWSHVDPLGFAVGWVAFVPWLWLLDRARSWRAALVAGWAMSVAFVVLVFGWFAVAIAGYTGAPLWLAYAILVATAPLVEPQFLAAALVRHALASPDRTAFLARAVGAAGAYVGTEWAFPKLLGDTVGYGFWQAPLLRQGADAIGPHGLTFVLLLVNECALATVVRLRMQRGAPARVALPVTVAAALVATLAGYGRVRLAQLAPDEGAATVTVAAIQAGLGSYRALADERGTFGAVRTVLDGHFALSQQALGSGAELVVWPETTYPTTFGAPKSADGAAFDREIAGFVAATGVPLVLGAYDLAPEDGREYNAALLLERDAAGTIGFDAYRKARLFPLTERVPDILASDAVRRRLPWLGTWQPGRSASVLRVDAVRGGAGVRIAPLICYDAVDAALVRRAVRDGAELLVTLSNDAWFASGDGPLQHLVVAGFRSIETRTPQVRATTTGISAIVTATGETLAQAAVGERAALVARVVPARAQRTLQLAWGDWFPPAMLAVAALLLALTRRDRARSSARPPGL